jgi:hypothetical protein
MTLTAIAEVALATRSVLLLMAALRRIDQRRKVA